MISIDDVSTDDLRQVLAKVEGKKPTQRVMAAINYLEEDEATLEDVVDTVQMNYTIQRFGRS